jgi:hypothetical protein
MSEVRKTWFQHLFGRNMDDSDVTVDNNDHERVLSTSPQVGYVAISSCKLDICKKQFCKIFINISNIPKILISLVSSDPHF